MFINLGMCKFIHDVASACTCSNRLPHIYYVSSLAVFPAEVQQRVTGLHVDEAFPRVCRHRTATQSHLAASELNQTARLSSSVTCTTKKSHSSLLHVATRCTRENFKFSVERAFRYVGEHGFKGENGRRRGLHDLPQILYMYILYVRSLASLIK